MLLAFSSACSFYFFSSLSLSLARSLRAKCKTEVQPGRRKGRGEFSSFLPFFFFLKQNSEVLGKGEAESKRGEAEPKSSPSYSSKMKKDFKASDPARRV